MKLLIVEDTKELCDALVLLLEKSGYTVDHSYDGKEGLEMARVNEYDLIILDINLPHYSGFDIAKDLRVDYKKKTPIIALTARYSIDDKLNGFGIGFDDYITKPFETEELLARVEALLRRSKPEKDIILKVGDIKLLSKERKVYKNKKEINLTKIEFNILEYLLRNRGIVVKNSELVEMIWGEDSDLLDPPVRAHIKNLRKKIGDDKFEIIKTIPGVGYKID
jgi:DNA-binding response OmpR family regulator